MTIAECYERYRIPLNLQSHMYRVAGVGKLICSHCNDIEIHAEAIVTTLLLHDMGNILKFDLTKTHILEQKDKDRIDDLLQTQAEFMRKYGKSPDVATKAILKELQVSDEIYDLYTRSHSIDVGYDISNTRWDEQIAFYCDMRVGPFGVLSIDERFDDLIQRYPIKIERRNELRALGKAIEQKLSTVMSISPQTIGEEEVAHTFATLKRIEL